MRRVWLASYPRSGVTFLRHVLERMYGKPTYSFYLGEKESQVGGLIALRDWPADEDSSDDIAFVKTHGIGHAPGKGLAIHLIRDGRDAIQSLSRLLSLKNLGDLDSRTKILIETGIWGSHTLAWLARPQTALIRFEDLIQNPVETVRGAVSELGLYPQETDDPTVESFETLNKMAPQFFVKGGVGTWKYEMSLDNQKLFEELHGAAIEVVNGMKTWITA